MGMPSCLLYSSKYIRIHTNQEQVIDSLATLKSGLCPARFNLILAQVARRRESRLVSVNLLVSGLNLLVGPRDLSAVERESILIAASKVHGFPRIMVVGAPFFHPLATRRPHLRTHARISLAVPVLLKLFSHNISHNQEGVEFNHEILNAKDMRMCFEKSICGIHAMIMGK